MKELQTREKRLLLALGLFALGFLAFRGVPWLIGTLSGGAAPGGPEDRVSAGTSGQVVELNRLDPQLQNYEVSRNPFVYGELPPPPAPPRPKPKVTPPPPPPPEPPPRPVDTGPKPPPIDYQFVGSFGPRDRRIGVLTDGDNIINVQKGERVGDVVWVENIGFETIELKYVDFPELPAVKLEVGN